MAPHTPKKILIIEDEVDIAQLVKLYLEKEGFRTATAKTGVEGLKLIKTDRPDMVVDNPIEGLTLAEVGAVFSKERRRGLEYPVTVWEDLMVFEEEWKQAPVQLYGRNGNSGTASFFREHILNGADFKKTMTVGVGSAAVVIELMRDRFGIGFSSIGYQTSEIRPVPLAAVKGGRYVTPTFETTMDGSYPLRRNLYLYVNRPPKVTPPGPLAEFVKFALSRRGQKIVVDQRYYPLPTMELNRLNMMWTTPLRTAAAEGPAEIRN